MTTMVGGNLEELAALENKLRVESDAVAELANRITATLASTTWTGPAADRFRSEWQSSFCRALTGLQQALGENAAAVANRRQAIQAATY
ncbi:MAG: WXG100 family type VII secretion target [Acidimicrobiia bacterium]